MAEPVKPERVDALTKAIGKLSKARDAAKAMDQARAAMGLMTNAAKKAADAQDKLSKSNDKLAAVEKRTAAARDKQQAASSRSYAKFVAASAGEQQKAAKKAIAAQAEWKAHNDEFNESFRDISGEIGILKTVMAAWAVVIGATAGVMGFLAAKAIEVTQERSRLLTTFSALGGGAKAGKEVLAVVDQLSSKLPIPREQIADIAKTMESAGFRGQALGKAVESVAAATALMGESGGAAAQKMLTTLAEGGKGADKMLKSVKEGGSKSNKVLQQMGLSMADLGGKSAVSKMTVEQLGIAIEKALAKKGAGPLAEMGATFPVMLMKMKEGFLSLFENLGPAVKPFMAAVKSLFDQFTRGKGPMKALGAVATQALGTIFKYATMAVRAISAFVAKSFTAKNVGKTWENIKSAIAKVAAVAGFLWAQFGPIFKSQAFVDGLVAVFKLLAVVMAVVAATFAGVTAAIGIFAGVVVNVWGIAANLVTGLVDAVADGIGPFVQAMANMASAGLDAFKSVLGIHSPSAVMAQMGGYVAEGAGQGIDAGAGDVQKSAVRLGAGAAGGAAKGAASSGKSSGKGNGAIINIAAGALVINAGGATITDEGLAIALERFALTVGA